MLSVMTTPAPTFRAWLDEWLTLQRSRLKLRTIKGYNATARVPAAHPEYLPVRRAHHPADHHQIGRWCPHEGRLRSTRPRAASWL